MREKIEALRERFLQELQGAQNSEAVEKLRVAYLGKKGSVTELSVRPLGALAVYHG